MLLNPFRRTKSVTIIRIYVTIRMYCVAFYVDVPTFTSQCQRCVFPTSCLTEKAEIRGGVASTFISVWLQKHIMTAEQQVVPLEIIDFGCQPLMCTHWGTDAGRLLTAMMMMMIEGCTRYGIHAGNEGVANEERERCLLICADAFQVLKCCICS